MMFLTPEGFALIKHWEGCRLEAYLDSGDLPTIGFGTIRYPDGTRVKMGDTCTQEQAEDWFLRELRKTETTVDDLTVDTLTPHQFDALVSFSYNEGTGEQGFRGSLLRRMVNQNPMDPDIQHQFERWCYCKHQFVQGLLNRRKAEALHYFS